MPAMNSRKFLTSLGAAVATLVTASVPSTAQAAAAPVHKDARSVSAPALPSVVPAASLSAPTTLDHQSHMSHASHRSHYSSSL